MAKSRGNVAEFVFGSDTLTNWTSIDCSMNLDEIDDTDVSSAGWKESLVGDAGLTITANLNYDPSAAGDVHDDIIAAYFANDGTETNNSISWKYRAAGNTYSTTRAKITSLSIGSPHNGVQTLNVTFGISGKPTVTAP
jgi:hypothetical protein